MPSPSPTPLRLVHLTLTGSALLTLGFVVDQLPLPPARFHSLSLLTLVALPLLIAAFALTLFNQQRLSKGVKARIWTEDQLNQARKLIDQPWLTTCQFVLLFGAVAAFFTRTLAHWHAPSTFLLLMLAGNGITTLKLALRKSTPPTSGPRIDWTTIQPIHSNHWGDPTPH
jgi:cytochrome bd-type quinol oxidase subunit 2